MSRIETEKEEFCVQFASNGRTSQCADSIATASRSRALDDASDV